MICKNCGNEIPDESIYCLKCGEKVIEEDFVEVDEQQETNEDEINKDNNIYEPYTYQEGEYDVLSADLLINVNEEKQNNTKSKNKRIAFFGVGVAVVIAIIIAIVFNIMGCLKLKENICGTWSDGSQMSMFGQTRLVIDEDSISVDNGLSSFFDIFGDTKFNYKVVSPTKIKVGAEYESGYSNTFTVYFSEDGNLMQITPSMTGNGAYDVWERSLPTLELDGAKDSI